MQPFSQIMKITILLVLCLPVLFSIGCAGVGFERDWKTAVSDYHDGKIRDEVSGPWQGAWKTKTNGHEGDLRCLVSQSERPGNYDFRYRATFFKVLRGGYQVNYDVKKSGGGYDVEGGEDLGLFGKFHHTGRIEGGKFNAKYSNQKGDAGGFEMTRPEAP